MCPSYFDWSKLNKILSAKPFYTQDLGQKYCIHIFLKNSCVLDLEIVIFPPPHIK